MTTCYVIGGGKGGVGKSTISINLALYLQKEGKSVAVVDCDPRQQASAKFFARTGQYEIPCEVIEKDLLKTLTAEDRAVVNEQYADYDAVVFDAPGDIEVSVPLFRIADVVVLPTRPQFPDVEELAEAALAVTVFRETRAGGLPETLVVLTQGDPRTNVAKEAIRELEVVQRELRIPISLNQLHYSVKYSESYSHYLGVNDMKRAPEKPKNQIRNLMMEIEEYGKRAESIRAEAEEAGRVRSAPRSGEGPASEPEVERQLGLAAAGNE